MIRGIELVCSPNRSVVHCKLAEYEFEDLCHELTDLDISYRINDSDDDSVQVVLENCDDAVSVYKLLMLMAQDGQ